MNILDIQLYFNVVLFNKRYLTIIKTKENIK